MRLSRVYVAEPLTEHAEYILTGATGHYLSSVLRVHDGNPLVVFNGQGGEFEAKVQSVQNEKVRIRTGSYVAVELESPLTIFLGHSICRGDRSDYVIQKATELGVARVDPLVTERTTVRLESHRAVRRVAHWQSIAVKACEQCGRNRVPEVSSVKHIVNWFSEQRDSSTRLVFQRNARRRISGISSPTGPVVLLVGPEGGLTSSELKLAASAGFAAVHLGPRTMRADTACVAALTVLQLRFGDLS